MALTLVEALKLAPDAITQAVIAEFAEGEIMRNIPFKSITGSGEHYNQEHALPGIGFRGINEAYDESTGVVNPESEPLRIAGGDLDVDVALVKMKGQSERTVQERMKVKALRMAWEHAFIKGDSAIDPRQFDGLQKRVTGSQLVSNAAAGGALSLAKLDQLISQVEQPTGLIMSRRMRDRLTAASRSTSVGGFISFETDGMGQKVAAYGGLPIMVDSISNPVLPFTETSPDGSSSTACTSIYCVSFGDLMMTGIQNTAGIEVRDLGELDSKPVFRTRVEWLNAFAIYNGYAVARLAGVTDVAVVA